MTMAGAIEGWSEAKVNISQQKLSKVSKSCLRCYILQIQKRSPFPAEVMKATYLNQRFSESLGLEIRNCQHHHSNEPI